MKRLLPLFLLLSVTPVFAQSQPACDAASIRAAAVQGGEVNLCKCAGTTLPSLNMTELPKRVILDGCGVAIIDCGGHGAGIDFTGTPDAMVEHIASINNCKVGVLSALDANHCTTRLQGYIYIDDVTGNETMVPGSSFVALEGSEDSDIHRVTWGAGARAGLYIHGYTSDTVPYTSEFTPTCQSPGSNLGWHSSINSWVTNPGGHAIEVNAGNWPNGAIQGEGHSDTDYLLCEGAGCGAAVQFDRPIDDVSFEEERIEGGFTQEYAGPLGTTKTYFGSNLSSSSVATPQSTAVPSASATASEPTPVPSPHPASGVPTGFTLGTTGMYYTAVGQCGCPVDRPICLIAVQGGATYCGPSGVY